MGDYIRLDKLLSNMGNGSRNDARDAIKFGQVKLNGIIVRTGKQKIDTEKDEVLFRGQTVTYQKFIYIMMHKPSGVISATEDKKHQTVIDLLDETVIHYEPFPVGRLDIDTEGLLILTNDGDLAHNLLSPKKHVPKTYYAKINKRVDETDVEAFKQGIVLDDDYKCKPSELTIIHSTDASAEIELIIYEGKFHQVKRMFESVDKQVTYLKRIKMGNLSLDENLPIGAFRLLNDEELALLKDSN